MNGFKAFVSESFAEDLTKLFGLVSPIIHKLYVQVIQQIELTDNSSQYSIETFSFESIEITWSTFSGKLSSRYSTNFFC